MNTIDGEEAMDGERSGNYGVCKGNLYSASYTIKKQLPISNITHEKGVDLVHLSA
jgi:hypothetical protein